MRAGSRIGSNPARCSVLIVISVSLLLQAPPQRSRDPQRTVALPLCPSISKAGTACFGLPSLPDPRSSKSPTSLAYIGPGAGFAFLGSFLTLVAGFFLSLLSLLLWPFRMVWRLLRRRKDYRKAHVKKTIFLGLDGLDPKLTERFIAEGKLPNLAKLAAQGSYRRLRTTFPSLSPVAWSTFATGVSPAKHNIFDFLDRDLKSYLPQLSSARVGKAERILRIGRWRIPLSAPRLELRQKSKPFWKILGERGVGCTILRVPITFPPERFDGKLLSAMCTPDLKGTQGSFSQFTTRVEKAATRTAAAILCEQRPTATRARLKVPRTPSLKPVRPFAFRSTSTAKMAALNCACRNTAACSSPANIANG